MCRLAGVVSRTPVHVKPLVDWMADRSRTFPDGYGAVVFDGREERVVRGTVPAHEAEEFKNLAELKVPRAGFWIRAVTDGGVDTPTSAVTPFRRTGRKPPVFHAQRLYL